MLIGRHYEIVLHALEDLSSSAVRIAKSEYTGVKSVYRSGDAYAA
jgi:predicted transcriptional regulator YheO